MSPGADQFSVLPRHIAFIMDGNGRWARQRGFARTHGHEKGVEVLRTITRRCVDLGVEEMTCFALSTENFRRRPDDEIDFLLDLLARYLSKESDELDELGVRLKFIGRIEELPPGCRADLERSVRSSSANEKMTLRLAINYGGRCEIVDAARQIAREVAGGTLDPAKVDEKEIESRLYEPMMPDPDLVIRTAGDLRISNFLLWQSSYSELYFAPSSWPDFTTADLDRALEAYQERERRFGSIGVDESSDSGDRG